MSATMRTLKLNLLADVSKFGKGLSAASKDVKGFSHSVNKYAKAAATALTGVGVAAGYAAMRLGKESITAASDLAEEMSKATVIFGDSAKEIKAFAKIADKSLGISKTAALQAAGNFAIFAKAAKLSGKEVPKFSKTLVTLSSDLASFYNTSTDDAITAIGSALRGEMEPIRKYGVLLNEATLEQAASNYERKNGIELERGMTGQLTGSGKVLATYQAILENTTLAQGDFNRTSEGLANQQRILAAGWENVKAGIGDALLPAMVQLVNYANDTLIPIMGQIADGFAGKPKSISNKLAQVGRDLGYGPDSGAYNIGVAFRDIGSALGRLFKTITDDNGNSASSLDSIAKSLEKVADGIDAVTKAWNSLPAKAVRGVLSPWNWSKGSGGSTGGGAFGGLGGSKAVGGTVRAGTPYRVGEFGPETFVPTTGGRIVPKGAGGAGGNTFIFNGVIDAESARRSIEKLLRDSSRRTGAVSFVGNHL